MLIKLYTTNINMNILVTGSKGFIGKHITLALKRDGYNVFEYDIDSNKEELINYIKKADFVIHLAGINRPLNNDEFYDGNTNFTKFLVDKIKENNRYDLPLIMSSSIQAELNNDYGKSKLLAENYLLNSGLNVFIYRLRNVFGKWCRPNYNSVFATFSYNIAHNLDIHINDENTIVNFNYIGDIVDEFLRVIKSNKKGNKNILYVEPSYKISLISLANLLRYFKKEVESDNHLPIIHDDFELKAFISFLAYLVEEGYSYNFAKDERGFFEELYKSKKYGQISLNMSYPNITKGEHYHTYKKEIFYVVKGKCEIAQRNIKTNEIIRNVEDEINSKPINILPFYTHKITNIGQNNSYTLMWISEIYSDDSPDTFKENV